MVKLKGETCIYPQGTKNMTDRGRCQGETHIYPKEMKSGLIRTSDETRIALTLKD